MLSSYLSDGSAGLLRQDKGERARARSVKQHTALVTDQTQLVGTARATLRLRMGKSRCRVDCGPHSWIQVSKTRLSSVEQEVESSPEVGAL